MEHNLGLGTVFKIELQRACTEHPFGFLGKLPESDFVGIFFFFAMAPLYRRFAPLERPRHLTVTVNVFVYLTELLSSVSEARE